MTCSKWGLVAICFIANLASPFCAKAETAARGVLIIDEFSPESPFGRHFRAQIHSTLDSKMTHRYSIYSEFLDSGQFKISAYEPALQAYLKSKYHNEQISVIVTLGSKALNFSLRLRNPPLFAAPIVFAAIDDGIENESTRSPNTTGTIAVRRFQDLVRSAKIVVPHLKEIVLVGEPLEHQPLRHHYRQYLQPIAKGLKVNNLTGLPIIELQSRVARLSDNSAIIYIPIYTDKSGLIHNPREAFKTLASVANRPIVVDSETFIGIGAAGGFVTSAKMLGQNTAEKVVRILKGEAASNIPVTIEKSPKPIFDSRELKRWGISERALPNDSEIRFRELSVWDRYRWRISAIGSLIVLLCLIIAWLLYERHGRRAAERESHQHLLEVTRMDRAMTASALSVSIAHEINQPLGAILSNAEAAELLLAQKSPDLEQIKEILADIRKDDRRAVDIIKHLRALLRRNDMELQKTDLNEVFKDTFELIKAQALEQGVTLQIESNPSDLFVRADPVHLQQVILNLAMNAVEAMQDVPKGKRILKLQTNVQSGRAIVSISDTGLGVPEAELKAIFAPFVTTKQQGTGLGLSICQTIINNYGGAIWVENGANGGAIFHFSLELAWAEAA